MAAPVSGITESRAGLAIGALVGLYCLFSIRVADQWEKVAVLRFGRFIGLRGPGLFYMTPIIDRLSRYVDQRVRVANVSAESTLTRDTVPVNVDAIVFWMVWNPEKAILEVQDFTQAITLSAQTALRESIGRHELHQMVAEREMLGKELQSILDEKTTAWGITVQSVEIRDVQIPQALQDAMSREAQGGTRTARAHHSGAGGDGDRREIRQGRAHLSGQSGSAASPRHEHVVRGA
ncbi:MAG: SPFH domain-containing protein [Ignavibacteriota bacterium]